MEIDKNPDLPPPPCNTDKAQHGYLPTYLRIASELGVSANVCELGVWGGGSLILWQTLFPGGIIVGVDRDRYSYWPRNTVKIVSQQDDPALPERLRGVVDGFDLIIDDASHDGALTRKSWELLWPMVKPGGYYVVEDWMIHLQYHGPASMLDAVTSFLPLLSSLEAEVSSVEYRYGMAIVRKRGNHDG